MKPRVWASAVLLVLGARASAGGLPHLHGHARLYIGVEGNTVTLLLETPLDNLLGFERAPRNERERQAVHEMVQRLRGGTLFVPNAEADCNPDEAVLESEVLGPAWLGGARPPQTARAPQPAASAPAHADFDGSFTYVCRKPAALRSMTIGLADAFRRIKTIDVQIDTAKGQTRRSLSGTARQVRW